MPSHGDSCLVMPSHVGSCLRVLMCADVAAHVEGGMTLSTEVTWNPASKTPREEPLSRV